MDTEILSMQEAYKAAVDDWVAAIREEESLASGEPTVTQVDQWEQAHFKENEARQKAKGAKKEYEDALRRKLYHF